MLNGTERLEGFGRRNKVRILTFSDQSGLLVVVLTKGIVLGVISGVLLLFKLDEEL